MSFALEPHLPRSVSSIRPLSFCFWLLNPRAFFASLLSCPLSLHGPLNLHSSVCGKPNPSVLLGQSYLRYPFPWDPQASKAPGALLKRCGLILAKLSKSCRLHLSMQVGLGHTPQGI